MFHKSLFAETNNSRLMPKIKLFVCGGHLFAKRRHFWEQFCLVNCYEICSRYGPGNRLITSEAAMKTVLKLLKSLEKNFQ